MTADPAKFVTPSGSYYIFGAPGFDGALPAGAAAQLDLFRTEDLLDLHVTIYSKPAGDGFIAFDFAPQHVAETDNPPPRVPSPRPPDAHMQLFLNGQDYPAPPPGALVWPAPSFAIAQFLARDSKRHIQSGTTVPHVQQRWWADVPFTQGTRLCFHVPSGIDDLIAIASAAQPDIPRLLDWSRWSLCLPPWGLSNSSFKRTPIPVAARPPGRREDAEAASTLAMSFGLVFVPTDTGGWAHFDQPPALGGRTELWHTRLLPDPKSGPQATLRAVWSLPQAIAGTAVWNSLGQNIPPGDSIFVPEPPTALVLASGLAGGTDLRTRLVTITSTLQSPNGAPELPADDVLLSGFGGSLTTGTTALTDDHGRPQSFHHSQSFGRDLADTGSGQGQLKPFGHQFAFTLHRTRVVDQNGVAKLQTRLTMRILESVRSFTTMELTRPFSSVRLATREIPELDQNLMDAVSHGPVILRYEALDLAGQTIVMNIQLMSRNNPDPMQIALAQQRVAYAIGSEDTTIHATDELLIAAPSNADFTVQHADIRHPGLAHFRTDPNAANTQVIRLVPPAGIGEALGTIAGVVDQSGQLGALPSVTAATANGGLNTSRFGAFVAPSLAPKLLSKTLGPVSATLEDAPAGAANNWASAKIATLLGDTQLFGLFGLGALLQSGWNGAQQSADAAKAWLSSNGAQIRTTRQGDTITVAMSMSATPPAGGSGFSAQKTLGSLQATLTTSSVTLQSSVTTGPPGSDTSELSKCVLGAPQIALGFLKDDGGLEDLIVLPLTDLTFEARSGHKPSINTNFGKPVFKGDLAFLNGIMAVLPSTLFGNPPQLVVDDTHAEASCGVTLPAFGFGMFDFRNVGLDADLTIRFDPSNAAQDTDGSNAALAFAFNFGTPQKPFSCAVALLEGQGSFGVVVTPAGLIVDASLAFGGGFELDLIVVSGGVSITAGVHLRKTPTEFEVAGFVHVTGGVEVLGLIGITLDAMLVLTWNTHVFTGKLSVTVGVHVLFFHTSVSFVLEKTFDAGGMLSSSQPMLAATAAMASPFASRPSLVSARAQAWQAYCAGFAP